MDPTTYHMQVSLAADTSDGDASPADDEQDRVRRVAGPRIVREPVENGLMPRISAFYGIVITMYWRDHPPAHFHAGYGGHVAEIAIDTLDVIRRLAASTSAAAHG